MSGGVVSKFPIIVIEGPDGVGKTTLSQALCKYIDAKYVHLTYRFKDRMHLYHGAALSYALKVSKRQPVVIDRWWPTEVAYANAYRGGTKWPLLHRQLERAALRHGVSYVFCLPKDRGRYLEHFNVLKGKREEMYDSGMDRVYDEFTMTYRRLVDEHRPGVSRYDFFEDGKYLDEVVQNILEVSEDERALIPGMAQSQLVRGFSGSPSNATHLIVGVRPMIRSVSYAMKDKPFPYPYVGQDGADMSRLLDSLNVPESQVAFAYIGEAKDDYLIKSSSRHMKVVALGAFAQQRLAEMEIPIYKTTPALSILALNKGLELFKDALDV
jgi:hypothetical protein